LLAASDEHTARVELGQRGVGRAEHEPAVERYLSRSDPESLELLDGARQKSGLARVPDPGRGRHDQATRAPRLVFSVTSVNWLTYPNSVGLSNFPLRIGRSSGSDSEMIRSVIGFARHALLDLPSHLLATICQLLEPSGSFELRARAAPPCTADWGTGGWFRRGRSPAPWGTVNVQRVGLLDKPDLDPNRDQQHAHRAATFGTSRARPPEAIASR
jgi:hypothetical protein